jgi:hypothetical protein
VDYTTGITQLSCDWVGLRSSGAGAVDTYLDYPLGAPAVPTGLTAVSGPLGIKLTWNANSEFDLDHYIVWKNTTNNPATATIIAEVDTTYFAYHGAAAEYGTTLYFWLSAIDWTDHQSDKTSSVNATVLFIDNVEIGPNAVEADNIQNAAVTEAKIMDLAISNAKLKDDVVTSGKIAGGAVYTRHLVVFQVLLDADPFTASGGKIYWTTHNLRYEGVTYSIAALPGGTSDTYVWWDEGASAYTHSNSKPDLSDTTLNPIVVFGPSTNTIYQVWKPTVVHGGMIVAETITGEEITGTWITGKHFRTSSGYPMVYIDETGIYGASGAAVYEFYLLSANGKAYTGGGAVILDKDGIHLKGVNPIGSLPFLEFLADDAQPTGYVGATGAGGDLFELSTYPGKNMSLTIWGTGGFNAYSLFLQTTGGATPEAIFQFDVLPQANGVFDLGSNALRWANAYVNYMYALAKLNIPYVDSDGSPSNGDIWIRSDL